jgi:hypothetical protein
MLKETSVMRDIQLPPLRETYQIRVKGNLDSKWEAWFDGFTIIQQGNDVTTMSGPVADQAALHGVLAKIRDLGLSLILVERLTIE